MDIVKKLKKAEADKAWLADWLDLSKYDDAAQYGIYRWGLALRARAKLLSTPTPEFPSAPQFYADLKNAPLNLGSYGAWVKPFAPVQDMSHLDVREQVALLEMGGIREIVEDWDSKYAEEQIGGRFLAKLFGKSDPQYRNEEGKPFPWFDPVTGVQFHPMLADMETWGADETTSPETVEVLTTAFVGVNLAYTDSTLIRAFSMWLENRRTVLAKARISTLTPNARSVSARLKLTEAAREQWWKLKVLPFIDIQIRAKFEGRKQPRGEVIGEYLFAGQEEYFQIEHQAAKKTAPLAKKLLRPESYEQMLLEGQQRVVQGTESV